MRIKGDNYLTPEQFRQLHGYAARDSIIRALRANRIPGAIYISGRWLIPANAILTDKRYKSGEYINWRRRYGKLAHTNDEDD